MILLNRVVVFCLLSSIVLVAQQRPADLKKIQTLIITGENDYHEWSPTTAELRRILEDDGRFEVRVTEEFRGCGPETLKPYDLVVLNFSPKEREHSWGEASERALFDFVRSGKGLVVYHYSVGYKSASAEYERLCGGNWRPGNGMHSPRHDFTVTIRDQKHPITSGMKKSFLQRNDELYANLKWQPAGTFHVLATAWDDHALYEGKAPQPAPGPGLDHPVLWTVNYGNGRVFVTVLGHDVEAMQSPGFRVTLQRGAEWAATGTVTTPVPHEPAEQ